MTRGMIPSLIWAFFRTLVRPFSGVQGCALLSVAIFLAACSPPPRTPQIPPSDYLSGPACIIDLTYRNVGFDRITDTAKPGACGVATAVSLQSAPFMLDKKVSVDCGLARQVALWMEKVVEPTARAQFGQGIKKVTHYGGYVCRGRTSNRSRLSEHAFGKAIDIAAFELEDGTQISVLKDWSAGGRKQEFLRAITAGSCPYFSVVLSPNSDADHANHLHLDIGPWKLCRS